MKCLVVDDSTTMRRIVLNALRSIGYTHTVEASDGVEALEQCDGTVEFVITDWNMPKMGGLDLVKHLREKPETAKIPILMVTTRSVKEDILKAVQAGINSYIVKPFTPQVLKAKIEEVLQQSAGAA
jgi:two-component system chemotaxis response regulator CheY